MVLDRRLAVLRFRCLLLVSLMLALSACGGGAGSGNDPITPTPTPAATAPTASLSASPTTIDQGQTVTLTWQTKNASSVSIQGIGAVSANGSKQLVPDASITYKLTAKGAGGTATATAAVVVVISANAPTASLTASPATIVKGQSVTLKWQTSRATSAKIEGIGVVPVEGSLQVSPADTTTYTLIAAGPGGNTRATTLATVVPIPIKHVVIIFQENRDTDNLFHDVNLMAKGADLATTGLNSLGDLITLQPRPLADDYEFSHLHGDFLDLWDGGKMDGADKVGMWCNGGGHGCLPPNPAFVYVDPADVQPYFTMAETYTFADHMFQTNQGPSFPAHQFIFAGTSAPTEDSDLFAADNPINGDGFQPTGCIAPAEQQVALIDPTGAESSFIYPCFEHATLSDLLDDAGISWRYYAQELNDIWVAPNAINHICVPSKPTGGICTGAGWNNVITPPSQVLTDIGSGNLAAVSWVTPPGLSSDHPAINDGSGPSWVASIVNAIGQSQYWSDTAIFITWDDWGGMFDHVPPPILNSYEYGARVPLIIISPYVLPAHITHVTHDFGSIVKFTEQVFGLPSLGFADAVASDFSDSFNYLQNPLPFKEIQAPLHKDFFLHDTRPHVPLDED